MYLRVFTVLNCDFRRQVSSVYSGGHSSSRSASPEMFTVPPPDMQLIIDKMASYVAKNGRDFEAIVRSKGKGKASIFIHRSANSVKAIKTFLIPLLITQNKNLETFVFHELCAVATFLYLYYVFMLFLCTVSCADLYSCADPRSFHISFFFMYIFLSSCAELLKTLYLHGCFQVTAVFRSLM